MTRVMIVIPVETFDIFARYYYFFFFLDDILILEFYIMLTNDVCI